MMNAVFYFIFKTANIISIHITIITYNKINIMFIMFEFIANKKWNIQFIFCYFSCITLPVKLSVNFSSEFQSRVLIAYNIINIMFILSMIIANENWINQFWLIFYAGSRQFGPGQFGPGQFGPGQFGPRQFSARTIWSREK